MSRRLHLEYRSSLNKKTFTLEDEIDESPLLKVEFVNDFFERIPPEVRHTVALDMLKFGLRRLQEEAEKQNEDRPRYNPLEGF